MPTFSRKSLFLMLLAVVITGASAWWVLVTPDNPLTNLFRREISDVNARIIIGPYPADRDFRLLKAHDVGLIVTLLDPRLPYEATLLQREKALAERHGIEVRNFPMSSVLGQRFGNYYDDSATRAAEAIASADTKVYLHCYLGMHRIQAVRTRLASRGIEAGTYAVRHGERVDSAIQTDAAEAAYADGRFRDALAALSRIDDRQMSPAARILRGWSHFRLGEIPQARAAFESAGRSAAHEGPAAVGLGYCALRDGEPALAERYFRQAIAKTPDDADALGGLGLVCYRSGKLDQAAAHLEAALHLAPDNSELQGVLERVRAARHLGGQ
ncbi:MAG: tetratricopeptide repeat protein [Acidobacteriota bacterium]